MTKNIGYRQIDGPKPVYLTLELWYKKESRPIIQFLLYQIVFYFFKTSLILFTTQSTVKQPLGKSFLGRGESGGYSTSIFSSHNILYHVKFKSFCRQH